jgi:hypothetical protein
MSYNYTNGDGVAVLLTSEPNGAVEPISNLDNAIRQIKSFLNDPTKGIPYIESQLTTLAAGQRNFFSAYSAANQSITVATTTKVNLTLELVDNDGVYTAASSRFTAPATGWYQFTTALRLDWATPSVPVDGNVNIRLRKNNTTNIVAHEFEVTNFIGMTHGFNRTVQLTAGDYVEVFIEYSLGSGSVTLQVTSDTTKTVFQGLRVI